MEERKRDGRGGKGGEGGEEKAWKEKTLPHLLTGTGQSEAGRGTSDQSVERSERAAALPSWIYR